MKIKTQKRSTENWTQIVEQWAERRDQSKELESYEVEKLNTALEQCFDALRTKMAKVRTRLVESHGSDFRPILQCKNYLKSIL